MLREPLMNKLTSMKLWGMLEGLREQIENPQYKELSFEERLGLLLDREWNLRQDRGLKRRLQIARFREAAVMEDLKLSTKRGLDRSQVLYLAQEDWIRQKLNVIITGPTGAGKILFSLRFRHCSLPESLLCPLFSDVPLTAKSNPLPGRWLLSKAAKLPGKSSSSDHGRLVENSSL